MSLRQWLRERVLGDDATGNDRPPGVSLVNTLLNRDGSSGHALGDLYGTELPDDLAELLQRRAEVAAELLRIDVTDPRSRIGSIPRLRELLRRYPHPLVYQMLIHAYVDAERFDEARGVAFAARERRAECARSPYPEVRGEVASLREWGPAEIEELKAEHRAREGS
ncbi:MAG TPA: hypothetical protein VFL93_03520 [Longimicrobiaceae bacterium]|nr:hypothetical protein [Longimicrobiaceae bacterium]